MLNQRRLAPRQSLALRGSLLAVIAFCGLPVVSPTAAVAQVAPNAHDAGHVPFDLRLDGDKTAKRVLDAVAAARALPAGAARGAALARLAKAIPGLVIDDNQFYGTPHFLRSTRALLTGASPAAPRDVARAFIAANQDLFEISPAEVDSARISRDFKTRHNGATHLTFNQQIEGLDIYDCMIKANITLDGRLINISSSMLPRPEGGFAVATPTLSAEDAIRAAAASIGVELAQPPTPRSDAEGLSRKQYWSTPALRSDEFVVTERQFFAVSRNDIRPAWAVVIPEQGIGHTYDMIIDAVSGELLFRHDRLCFETTQPASYRIYTSDSPAPGSPGNATPNAFQFPFVPRSLVTILPADIMAFSPNGWIPDGASETMGNNVDAHLDVDGSPNVPDVPRPNGGASRTFDFALDTALAPSTYRNASVTQLFYLSNVYHDRLYAMGFDEPAGNFQNNNFGLGGLGNDAVQADAQDGSGTNNANFATPVDGGAGRMQMYVFTGPTPDRDGTLDGDIVYHELTHGTSNRLHAGITALQTRSMGEGWGDFFGMCLNAEPMDDPNANYCTGGYAVLQLSATFFDNYYYGIRRFPYSTNLLINPQTFADIDPGQQFYDPIIPRSTVIGNTANEVHNAGEIWCLSLWECRARLYNTHGFAANQLIMQLVIDGMKLSPAQPTFLQSRDAIIQADLVNNGGVNGGALWAAFAKRGMGYGATSPASTTTAGVVEAFDVPQRAIFEYPDGRPSQLQPAAPAVFRVNVTPDMLTLTAGTGQLHYSVEGGSFTSIPMVQGLPNQYTATLPGFACLEDITYYVSVDTSVGLRADPDDAPAAGVAARVFQSSTLAADENFETAVGWTVGPNTATSGVWVRVDPVGTTAQPEDDASATGTMCWVTGQGLVGGGLGDNDVDAGATVLTSPAYDTSAFGDAAISYNRWYSNGTGGAPFTDVFRIEYSTNNGANWSPLETVGPAGAGTTPGWVAVSYRMSDLGVVGAASLKFRFTAEDIGTGSLVEAAIDDLRIVGVICSDSVCGSADFNGDGDIGTDIDIEAFFACLGGSCCPTCGSADFNGDGDVGTDLDIEAFFRVLGGGTC